MLSKTHIASAIALFITETASAANLRPEPALNNDSSNYVRNTDEQLAFVFELVRHGARAPIEDRDLDEFPVDEGWLTPEGMRQRYLLGRHNRQRYMEYFGLISSDYNPLEVQMQSTDVFRTIQSGYSELMGLYPPSQSSTELMTPPMEEAVSTFSAPPFKVRDADAINQKLGDKPLADDFVQIPIFEFINNDINDDASTDGCPYINKVGDVRKVDDTIWAKYQWMQEQTEKPVEEALDLSQEYIDSLKLWHDYQLLTDTIVALDFEGDPKHKEYFSDEQWETLNEYQKVWLTDDWSKDARDLMMSRVLRKPLALMARKVQNALDMIHDNTEGEDVLKYLIYSAHDTQVVNMMDFLQKDFYFTPFASQVTFELKYSAKCLVLTPSEDCFSVGVAFNGSPQMFEGCTGDHFTLEGCTYPQFVDYINERWYSGPESPDLDAACFAPVV